MTMQQAKNYMAGRVPDPACLLRIAQREDVTIDWILRGTYQEEDEKRPRRSAVVSPPVDYRDIPDDLASDARLLKAIRELVDILHAPDEKATEWLLGNIEVFAREARRHVGVKKRAG